MTILHPGPATMPVPGASDDHLPRPTQPARRGSRPLVTLLVVFGVLVIAIPAAVLAVASRPSIQTTITPQVANPPAATATPPAGPSAQPSGAPAPGPTGQAWSPGRYTAVRLAMLAGSANYGTFAFGLNERGLVVGQSEASNGRPHPVLWDHGRIRDLGVLATGPDEAGEARDLNENGDIVGGSAGPNGQRAVLWRDGRIIDLGVLDGGVSSFAYAINDRGQVVGTSRTAAGQLRGFLWQDGVMRDLGIDGGVIPRGINNRGQVVGSLDFGDGGAREQAFLWQDGVVTRLPAPGLSSRAVAINDRGEVVGSYIAGYDEGARAVRWYRGTMIELGHLSKGNASGAGDINAQGQIVGSANLAPHGMEEHPFLWWRGVMHDLAASGISGEFWLPAVINDRGQIAAGHTLYTPA